MDKWLEEYIEIELYKAEVIERMDKHYTEFKHTCEYDADNEVFRLDIDE